MKALVSSDLHGPLCRRHWRNSDELDLEVREQSHCFLLAKPKRLRKLSKFNNI